MPPPVGIDVYDVIRSYTAVLRYAASCSSVIFDCWVENDTAIFDCFVKEMGRVKEIAKYFGSNFPWHNARYSCRHYERYGAVDKRGAKPSLMSHGGENSYFNINPTSTRERVHIYNLIGRSSAHLYSPLIHHTSLS